MAVLPLPGVTAARWPTGHFAWLFAGVTQFAGGATTFLAEGLSRGERAIFIADDPRPDLWPRSLLARRALVVASTAEVYGPDRRVSAPGLRDLFAPTLEEALRAGQCGLRVALDASSLVRGPERLDAWMEWEEVADELMADNPVTGMCGFDWGSLDTRTISFLVGLHEVSLIK